MCDFIVCCAIKDAVGFILSAGPKGYRAYSEAGQPPPGLVTRTGSGPPSGSPAGCGHLAPFATQLRSPPFIC
jgi:hypothetical protein